MNQRTLTLHLYSTKLPRSSIRHFQWMVYVNRNESAHLHIALVLHIAAVLLDALRHGLGNGAHAANLQ